jgi:phosphoribosylformylglycinamidine (FGAM) synthase-like enzyme
MEHWFVYYKLPAADAARCIAAARRMQRALAVTSGVHGQLLQRTDEAGANATLLEIYPKIADPVAFAALLDQALQAAALPVAGRHLERFAEV